MDKLRLLRKLHDEELFDCLSGEELRIFLLMANAGYTILIVTE